MIHKQTVIHGSIITVPYASNFIKVAYQGSDLTVWYAFAPDSTRFDAQVEIAIVGTGWDFDLEGWSYLDSVFDDPFVWHIFLRERE